MPHMQEGGTEPFQDRKLQRGGFREAYRSFWDGVVQELHAAELLFDDMAADKAASLAMALSWCVCHAICAGCAIVAARCHVMLPG